MKKLLIIVLLYLLMCVATWTNAGQGGVKSTDTETPAGVVQATRQKALARLDGLDRLYLSPLIGIVDGQKPLEEAVAELLRSKGGRLAPYPPPKKTSDAGSE